jgi:hypothetical protein
MELFFTMGLLRRIRDTDTARDLFSDYLQISEDFVLILRLCLLIFTYNFANGLTVKRPPHAKFKMLWEDLFLYQQRLVFKASGSIMQSVYCSWIPTLTSAYL